MKKVLLALVTVLLILAVAMAVKPTGERQGTEEDSAPPNTGVFGQCGNDKQCDDGDLSNGAEWCDKSTHPGHCEDCRPTQEVCDGLDNDCNGEIDEGTTTCGVGACENTVDMCVEGAPNNCVPLDPSPEVCDDGIDNDCDGYEDGDDKDCAFECDPQYCGAMPQCSDTCSPEGLGNACFLTAEGDGICAGHFYCANKVGCDTSADCAAAGVDGVCVICTGCDYWYPPYQGVCNPASNYCLDNGARAKPAAMQAAAYPDGRTSADR